MHKRALSRPWLLLAVAVVVTSCGWGSAKAAAPPPLYLAPTGVDTNRCTQQAPCATFDRAYRVAKSGGTVLLLAGAYPGQLVTFDQTKTGAAPVTFGPAPGAAVTVDRLQIGFAPYNARGPQHLVVRDLAIGYTGVWDGSNDITLLNLRGRAFDVLYGQSSLPPPANVRILGGNFGPCEAVAVAGECTNRMIGTNIVVDGATVHDVTSNDLITYHVDGIFVRGCQDCIIRNSKFLGNAVTNIRVQNCCDLPPNQSLTIQNNWFGASIEGDGRPRGDAIDLDNPLPGLVIRNNSFAEHAGIQFSGGGWTGMNARIVNNLMVNFPCTAGVTYSHNLFIPFSGNFGAASCGPTDVRVRSFGYVNAAGFDYHLTAASPALGHADANSCPSTDIDRRPRSHEIPCDVGSDQRRDTVACVKAGRRYYKTTWVNGDWLRTKKRPGVSAGACPKSKLNPKAKA